MCFWYLINMIPENTLYVCPVSKVLNLKGPHIAIFASKLVWPL